MTDKTQPEALRLADAIKASGQFTNLHMLDEASAELLRQHARIVELEAELEAVVAGGVQALSAAPAEVLKWPKDAKEVREFMHTHCITEQYAVGIESPSDDDKYLLSAHDFLSAVNWWADFPHYQEASPTPPAEQPIGEVVVTKTRDGQIVSVTRQDDEGRILSVIATSDTEEQQAAPKAAPSEGSDETDWYHGITEKHFDRAVQKAIQRDRASRAAAPKAAPGEPDYSEKWDADLGRTAMRFVDRAGDVHPGIDDAETICAEFHNAMSEVIARMSRVQRMAAPQQEAQEPSADVQAKIVSNTWDHFGDILPTLKAISRGDWYWGANTRCKYIEIRIDTRDGGCILYDSKRVRISPQQFAHQSYDLGKMDPWPAKNALGDTAPQPAPAPLSDDAKDAARWRWLSEHIGAAWNEGKFTSLVRIVSDKNRAALNASIDRMMTGDWSDAALAAQKDTP